MIDFITEYNVYCTLFLAVLFLLLGFWVVQKLAAEKDRKLELMLKVTAAVSVILVCYNLILSTQSNNRIEENRVANLTLENIKRNWLTPQTELADAYPEGFFLYRSMTPDIDYHGYAPKDFDSAKREQIEVIYSIRVFQAMEDFLTIGAYDLTGKYVWINNFLMWLQSPILQNNWNLIGFNFSRDTRKMVERLIRESKKLTALRKKNGKVTKADYDKVADAFVVEFR